MLRHILVWTLAVCVTSPVIAEGIAVLDVVQVVNESNANKRAESQLQKEREAAQAKVRQMEEPLLKEQRDLEQRRSVLSQDQFLEEQGELRKKIRQFKAEAQSLQEELQRSALSQRKEIADTVNDIVQQMGKERNYDMVVPTNVVIYHTNTVDITAEVLDLLNQKLK